MCPRHTCILTREKKKGPTRRRLASRTAKGEQPIVRSEIAYNLPAMTVAVRSFAKINLGLYIGAARADGYHNLRTVYQTIALHDIIRVSVERNSKARGSTIEILCDDPRAPRDSSNTCYRVADRVMQALGVRGRITIEIEKKLPVQGGLGAASSNAVATMLALEKALTMRAPEKDLRQPPTLKPSAGERSGTIKSLSGAERLRIAAEVGSDLPLFLVGGTVLGVGHGEEVYPLPDFPATAMVVVTPDVGISTPNAFADWDELAQRETDELRSVGQPRAAVPAQVRLTHSEGSDRLVEVGCALSAWLSGLPDAGAPVRAGSRAGSLLSDLVRAGIGNDFERVVFSQFPELRDIKRALECAGSRYASLSGSGSTLYGLFGSPAEAAKAAARLRKQGLKAVATRTLTRREYWKKSLVAGR